LEKRKLTDIDMATHQRRGPQRGYRHIPEARLRAALKRSLGNLSVAARECGCSRQAVSMRVERSTALQEFIRELQQETVDLAENVIVKKIRKGCDRNARWFLEHHLEGKNRGYGPRIDTREVTPPDPDAEAKRRKAIAFFSRVIEERARLGLPSVFDDSGAITYGAVIATWLQRPLPPYRCGRSGLV